MSDLISTVTSMTTGWNEVAGSGEQWSVVFDGTWRPCDQPQIILTTQDGLQTVIGFGDTNSFTPTFLLTFRDKVYAACDTFLAFSAIGEPTQFQDREVIAGEDADAPGNGFIEPGNNFATPENIVALAQYQGKMAIINRNSTQIWAMEPDPANNQQQQILENVGTMAPLSVQSVGTLDVMMLADSGFRSLRARDSSNNAIVLDIGTPVDSPVQTLLATLSEAEKAAACSIVEPRTGRYWCFIPGASGAEGTIYVLSYFPTANIAAWTTYRPTYASSGVQTAFTPKKFVVKDGQVFARTANGLIAYGGSTGEVYDNCGVTVETPWMDAKTPATRKHAKALDAACQGSWVVSVGMDPLSSGPVLNTVYTRNNATNASSFTLGHIPFRDQGTHFKIKMVENSSAYARFSATAFHYELAEAG